MRTLSQINDPVFKKKEKHNALDSFFLKFIRDERDLPFIRLSILISITLIPSAVILFTGIVPSYWWWVHAAVHFVLCMAVFMGPFTLMLHNTSHRPFFKKEYNVGNYYIPWVIGFLMGQPPHLYYAHHIGMHHSEGNLPEDRSSTMKYQRDNFWHFMHYFSRFLFIGIIDLADYFKTQNQKKRAHFMPMLFIGESLYALMCVGLCFISLGSTMIVFVAPLLLIRLFMMMGNWAQHAFVSQEEPNNDFKNSITCINSAYNKQCFNDGYHIGHHLFPAMHWTDMPGEFLKNKDKYATQKAIVFEKLDYNQIWFFLVTKRYDKLASYFVNINDAFQSDEEIIAMLKSRTKQFDAEGLAKYAKVAS